MQACQTHQSDVVVTFVDFAKAFDSVNRGNISKLLALFNVPPVLVNAVMSLYSYTSSFVRSHYGGTNIFATTSGVLQGDMLAPFLFTLRVDYVLRHCCPALSGFTLNKRTSCRHPEKRLADLDFVDDIAMVSNSIKDAQATVSEIERVGRTVGLRMNTAKTKFIAIGSEQGQLLTSSGPVQRFQSFKYLGSILPSTDHSRRRKTSSWIGTISLKTSEKILVIKRISKPQTVSVSSHHRAGVLVRL